MQAAHEGGVSTTMQESVSGRSFGMSGRTAYFCVCRVAPLLHGGWKQGNRPML